MFNQYDQIESRKNGTISVLIVEDTADHAELISVLLKREDTRLEIHHARDVAGVLSQHDEISPDLILTDYRLGSEDCFDVLRALKGRDISTPVIILTGQGDEKVAAEAVAEGAYDYLIKDQVFTQTSSLIKSIHSALERYQLSEALRESEELYRTLVENILDGVFIIKQGAVVFVNPAFASILQADTEIIINRPFRELFTLGDRPRIDQALKEAGRKGQVEKTRFVLVGPENKPRIHAEVTLNQVIYAGSLAIIGTLKDITVQVEAELEMAQLLEEKRLLSVTDELTGLFNRRHILENLTKEIERARRYEHDLSVLMFDLDNFKTINDSFGHLTGDDALRTIAEVLENYLRDTDTAARYGGDEFLIVMPHTSRDQAVSLAERIRQHMVHSDFSSRCAVPLKLTPSMGVSSFQHGKDREEDLIQRADKALIQAKREGKNRVVVLREDVPADTDGLP